MKIGSSNRSGKIYYSSTSFVGLLNFTSNYCMSSLSKAFTAQPNGEDETLCRLGKLFEDLSTPCYIPPSIAGAFPHLTPDNCKKFDDLKSNVVNFSDISASLHLVKDNKLNFQEFLNVAEYKVILSAMDYLDDSNNPQNSKAGFTIQTNKGRKIVTSEEFMDAANLLKPHCIIPIADEIKSSFGNNRQRSAMEVSLDWLDKCIEYKNDQSMLCGVVLGGSDERLRAYATEEICKRNIDGLFVSGLDSIDEEEKRNALIDTVIKHSKSSLPRFLGGIGDPKDVLNAVEKGMDAFISAYPYKETQKNSALIFWVDEKDNVKEREMERNRSGVHIFLKDKRFEKDFRPLLHDCECFSCKNYSRAYIHHLLNVKEMLGDVLLFTHNIFHYFRFFRTIRAQIGTQQFRAYKKLFTSKYQL